ncbi:MAG: dihydrofolate reductase family protein [Desulfofustis sp.]|nr:dihydrofolate reductase family protein [Desulfofustis sp.]NNK57273.1 GTP cyclohydrolase [Desulfofustis sp.]
MALSDNRLTLNQEAWFDSLPQLADDFHRRHQRPLVTLSFAQSLDGSIATWNRQQLALSSRESMILTHRIRAVSDAIVIGINTLLTDDPQLTVRHVEGPDPQPIVLDSNLRIPSTARLLTRSDQRCWLACIKSNSPQKRRHLEDLGAELLYCGADRTGRVNLPDLLGLLGQKGIKSIMVEGGSQVITSFIESRLVDKLIITIAPRLVGGLSALHRPVLENSFLHLNSVSYQPCGPDLILWASPNW